MKTRYRSRHEHWNPGLASRSRRGFTIVELLVVISVISLLVSILLPALEQTRNAARSMACLSQYRQMGVAVLTFSNDHDQVYPYSWRAVRDEIEALNLPQAEEDQRIADYRAENNSHEWYHLVRPYVDGPLGVHTNFSEQRNQDIAYCTNMTKAVNEHVRTDGLVISQAPIHGEGGTVRAESDNFSTTNMNNFAAKEPEYVVRSPSALMLLAERYQQTHTLHSWRHIYFNPNHGFRAPTLHADGHAQMLPDAVRPYAKDNTGTGSPEVRNSPATIAYWGMYIKKPDAHPFSNVPMY